MEADSDSVWYLGDPAAEVGTRAVEFFTIHEIDQGSRWEVMIWLRAEDMEMPGFGADDHPGGMLPGILTKGGIEWDDVVKKWGAIGVDASLPPPQRDGLWQLLIEAVHYITARGVSLADAVPDRAARRRAQRGGYTLPEKLYWVRIDETRLETTRGVSDRTYHCRWLVRGHWRRTSDTARTWIRPYVKGPAGAPWRGRPMYHVTGPG